MSEETKIPVAEEGTEAPKKEKKKSKKDSELDALKNELAIKNDQLMRTAAEFDNFKKRTEREKASVAEFAKAGLIKQLLPILDNIDRASAADHNSADYIKGIEIRRFLFKVFHMYLLLLFVSCFVENIHYLS